MDARPEDQSDTGQAIFSLSMGVFVQVSTGLLLLLRTMLRMLGDASEQSEIDALSQIYNRRGFDRHVMRRLMRKGPDTPYAIIMSDLDYFKRVNDTYGHDCGDRVIEAFGGLLERIFPNRRLPRAWAERNSWSLCRVRMPWPPMIWRRPCAPP